MTAQEKAKELISKMKPTVIDDAEYEQKWWHEYAKSQSCAAMKL